MDPLMDNYLALYLSITKRYSSDKALKVIGILDSSNNRKIKNINEVIKSEKEITLKKVQGGY